MAKPRYTAKQVAKAITANNGLLSYAAKTLGCARQTVEAYVARHEVCREAVRASREAFGDVLESALMKRVDAGDTTAIAFGLRCVCKRRGYVERTEVTGAEGRPITLRLVADQNPKPPDGSELQPK